MADFGDFNFRLGLKSHILTKFDFLIDLKSYVLLKSDFLIDLRESLLSRVFLDKHQNSEAKIENIKKKNMWITAGI